jgi:hypothetical protein
MKTTISQRVANTIEEVVDRLGVSLLAVKVLGAAGCPQLEQFAPHAETAAELARHFGVSRSTAGDWIKAGAPREDDGTYVIPKVRAWRVSQQNPPENMARVLQALHGREPTGELVRALCFVLRMELFLATTAAAEEIAASPEVSEGTIGEIIARHMAPLCLDDPDVDRLLCDCAKII